MNDKAPLVVQTRNKEILISEPTTIAHAGRFYQAGAGLQFTIIGKQETAGSKTMLPVSLKDGRRINMITEGKDKHARARSKTWRSAVQDAATAVADPLPAVCASIWASPLYMLVEYVTPRPASHFNSKSELNKQGREKPWPTSKPDVLKLTRAVEDALNDLIYKDDAAIVVEHISKCYGARHVTTVTIRPLLDALPAQNFLLDTLTG